MVACRKQNPVLVYGDYEELFVEHKQVYSYVRTLDDVRMLIILNFSDELVTVELPEGIRADEILINNSVVRPFKLNTAILEPWQAVICTLS